MEETEVLRLFLFNTLIEWRPLAVSLKADKLRVLAPPPIALNIATTTIEIQEYR